MRMQQTYLTESTLGEHLARLFPGQRFVHDQAVPRASIHSRPDYRCEHLKLIVEFDDDSHYRQPAAILRDIRNDDAFKAMGYRIARIPYFVQLSPEVADHLFPPSRYTTAPTHAHGFIADEALLPASFCALGIERFRNDLQRFHFIASEIIASLRAKVRQHGDPLLVVPPSLLDLVTDRAGETEGVSKFHLDFRQGPAPHADRIAPLNAWRTLLHRLGLTAQDPRRYGGVAFGNVSVRAVRPRPEGPLAPQFLISGTQTGGLARLDPSHYCRVLDYDLATHSLRAEGVIAPSSESLTHAAIYRAAHSVHCVLHVHSPEMWRHAEALGIPVVDARIAYGTPEMAEAVAAQVRDNSAGVLSMGGHQDGILAYGATVDETALTLIRAFAAALQWTGRHATP